MNATLEPRDRDLVVSMLEELIGTTDRPSIDIAMSELSWQEVEAGDFLFRQGDSADGAYLVVSGRLEATRRGHDGQQVRLSEMGRGEIVGERGLLDSSPRAATVRALRDTRLARFSGSAFEALLLRHSSLALQLTRTVLRRAETSTGRVRSSSIAVVVTSVSPAADQLGTELAARLSAVHVAAEFSGTETGGDEQLVDLLHRIDDGDEHLVLEADRNNQLSQWSRRCVRLADRVVFVCSPQPDSEEVDHLRAYLHELETLAGTHWWLAVVHDADTARYEGTAAVIEQCGGEAVIHLRSNGNAVVAADIARLARLLTGHGIGLVLAGGGARGFAHIGVYRAMCELGIPVDAVGGASIGAPIGAGIALGLSPKDLQATVTRQFKRLLDYTVPLVAVLRGERIGRNINDTLGGRDIEDLLLGFYCVSTNLTAARLEVHTRGNLAQAVRASVSIPGVLPPVCIDGQMLVDGGVLSNLPIEPMRCWPGIGTVISVDLPDGDSGRTKSFDASLSGWKALGAKLRRSNPPYPSAGQIVVGSILVGSRREKASLGPPRPNDLAIEVHVPGVGLLEFDKVDQVANAGYATALPLLREWLANRPSEESRCCF